jgi:tRNA G18 (ribose-2'-O)-methylase SpoU
VWLCGICCCPPNNEIHKTALGAEETVDWRYYENTQDAVRALQADGYTVYAIEQAHGSTLLQNMQLPRNQKTAIVMGHEVFGVQQEVVDAADGCIEIPQYGTKHSLNVSVTAGIVMYELSNMLR